jgi:hypothetical protein
MCVIWHEQKQFQIPLLSLMVNPCRFEQGYHYFFMAELIHSTRFCANGNEIRSAKPGSKMLGVV